jgi:hypothetical protein
MEARARLAAKASQGISPEAGAVTDENGPSVPDASVLPGPAPRYTLGPNDYYNIGVRSREIWNNVITQNDVPGLAAQFVLGHPGAFCDGAEANRLTVSGSSDFKPHCLKAQKLLEESEEYMKKYPDYKRGWNGK